MKEKYQIRGELLRRKQIIPTFFFMVSVSFLAVERERDLDSSNKSLSSG